MFGMALLNEKVIHVYRDFPVESLYTVRVQGFV